MLSAQDTISPNRSIADIVITLLSNQQTEDIKNMPQKLLSFPIIYLLEIPTIELNLSNTIDLFDRKQSLTLVSDNVLKTFSNGLDFPDWPSTLI